MLFSGSVEKLAGASLLAPPGSAVPHGQTRCTSLSSDCRTTTAQMCIVVDVIALELKMTHWPISTGASPAP
ncbi:unannotated protein [freshwater metagenome]|uniref:Unannotated protein n=1 Tax=freshwater metagenome TaxID=449393 RepID=A0A6J7KKM7_9ZZZZ